MSGFNIEVSLLDINFTKEIFKILANVLDDERVDEKIRREYWNKIIQAIHDHELTEDKLNTVKETLEKMRGEVVNE